MTTQITRKQYQEMKKAELRKGKVSTAKKAVCATAIAATLLATQTVNAEAKNVTVQSGDTIFKIASQNGLHVDELKKINHLNSDVIYPNQVLQVSTSENKQQPVASQVSSKPVQKEVKQVAKLNTYTVQAGDSLSSIAKKLGTTVSVLKDLNMLKSDTIYAGQSLIVSGSEKAENPTKNETSSVIGMPCIVYTVQAGDTFYLLEEKFGVSRSLIKEWNDKETDFLLIGERLVIFGESYKGLATFVGAVDNHSIEVKIDGEHQVLEVGYQMSSQYEKYTGQTKQIQFIKSAEGNPRLVTVK